VYYKRFVYSDFNKSETELRDASAEVNLKLWANNPDTAVNIYVALLTHEGAQDLFGKLESVRKAGHLNNVKDVEDHINSFPISDAVFFEEVKIDID
jgi:hypothetical protein